MHASSTSTTLDRRPIKPHVKNRRPELMAELEMAAGHLPRAVQPPLQAAQPVDDSLSLSLPPQPAGRLQLRARSIDIYDLSALVAAIASMGG